MNLPIALGPQSREALKHMLNFTQILEDKHVLICFANLRQVLSILQNWAPNVHTMGSTLLYLCMWDYE